MIILLPVYPVTTRLSNDLFDLTLSNFPVDSNVFGFIEPWTDPCELSLDLDYFADSGIGINSFWQIT